MQEEAPHSCGYVENMKNVQNNSTTPLPTPLPNHCSSSRHLLGTLQAAHEDALGPLRQGRRLQAGEKVDIVTALALLKGVAAAV